jgi:uncharacterized protein YbaR (Trm112 family)
LIVCPFCKGTDTAIYTFINGEKKLYCAKCEKFEDDKTGVDKK